MHSPPPKSPKKHNNNNPYGSPKSPGSLLLSPGAVNRKTLRRTSILSVKKKSIWPELVGMTATEARRRIREEIPNSFVQIVGRNDMITEEYLAQRVQIFVDDDNIVTWAPQIG